MRWLEHSFQTYSVKHSSVKVPTVAFAARVKKQKTMSKKKLGRISTDSTETSTLLMSEGGTDIDGSMLEGGGQILRYSAALSAITKMPIRVSNIRAKRKNPGLRPQHLAGLKLVTEVCTGHLEGGTVGSSKIVLTPGRSRAGRYSADPGTAGSCTLLAQAAVPVLVMAAAEPGSSGRGDLLEGSSLLELRGGTDADMAPPVGYMQHVLLPTLRRLYGLQIDDQLDRRGFYPKGGGSLAVSVQALSTGETLPAIQLTQRGDVKSVRIHAFTAGSLKPEIADRLATAAELCVQSALGHGVQISKQMAYYNRATEPSAVGDGCGILLVAETASGCLLGSASPGQRGTPAEDIGLKAAKELIEDLAAGGCVDRWLEDQLIIFMALAKGDSVITCSKPSLHTRTAMTIAEQLTAARFTVVPPDGEFAGGCYTIRCRGAGIRAQQP